MTLFINLKMQIALHYVIQENYPFIFNSKIYFMLMLISKYTIIIVALNTSEYITLLINTGRPLILNNLQ